MSRAEPIIGSALVRPHLGFLAGAWRRVLSLGSLTLEPRVLAHRTQGAPPAGWAVCSGASDPGPRCPHRGRARPLQAGGASDASERPRLETPARVCTFPAPHLREWSAFLGLLVSLNSSPGQRLPGPAIYTQAWSLFPELLGTVTPCSRFRGVVFCLFSP